MEKLTRTAAIKVSVGVAAIATCLVFGMSYDYYRLHNNTIKPTPAPGYEARPTLQPLQVVSPEEAGYTEEELNKIYNSNTPR